MKKQIFEEEIYKKAGINDLIIFSIYSLAGKKDKCTFEKLLKECFSQFPKIFCFVGLSQWPDSRKLDRPLRTLRFKKLISGTPQKFFSLTKAGEKIAKEISKTFNQRKLRI